MAQIVDQRLPDAGYNGLNTTSGSGYGHTCYATNASAGKAMLASATTGNQPTLWNPVGSGVYAVLRSLTLQWTSGTITTGGFLWALTSPAGSAIGTAAPIVTFTAITPGTRAHANGSHASTRKDAWTPRCKWAPTVCTFVAAPTIIGPVGYSAGAFAEATAAVVPVAYIPIDGEIIVAPDEALTLVYDDTTSTALFNVKLVYDEVEI